MNAHTAKRLTFNKAQRILQSNTFQHIFRNANKRVNGKYWRLVAADNPLPHPRLGLSIAKKVLNKATKRNRYKRLAREFFRKQQHQLVNKDYVVIAIKPTVADPISNNALTDELAVLFNRCY